MRGSPNSNGVYSGSITYDALADGQSHNYSFFSVGIDDEQKAQAMPTAPDVTFDGVKYSSPLAVENLVVEKGIAERSFIEYLDVDFNQTASSSTYLASLASELSSTTATNKSSYLELLWYGEGTPSASSPKGSVNLFGAGTTAKVSLTGNDLSISFGANGITSLLTETGVSGTGKPTTNFGDGWYALGIDTTGGGGPVFWEPFFRLFGSATGDTTVTGPYTTAGTDAYVVYNAEGNRGRCLNADVDGSGAVNSKDLTYTVAAKGDSVGAGFEQGTSYPAFQLFAGSAVAAPVNATLITQSEVQALVPAAIGAWQAAGLDAADVRKLESVPIQVSNLGTTILGLEAGGVITINQTAAGYNWYVSAGSGSNQAFGLAGPDGESLARPGSPAADEVDLVTVLEHELGHVLGLPDNAEDGDLMDITIGLGVRRVPSSADLAAVASSSNIAAPGQAVPLVTNGRRARSQSDPRHQSEGPKRTRACRWDSLSSPSLVCRPPRSSRRRRRCSTIRLVHRVPRIREVPASPDPIRPVISSRGNRYRRPGRSRKRSSTPLSRQCWARAVATATPTIQPLVMALGKLSLAAIRASWCRPRARAVRPTGPFASPGRIVGTDDPEIPSSRSGVFRRDQGHPPRSNAAKNTRHKHGLKCQESHNDARNQQPTSSHRIKNSDSVSILNHGSNREG